MGVAAATDDPVHPLEVAVEWVAAAPRGGAAHRHARRDGRRPRQFSARRAWPRCWSSEPALAAGDGAQLLHRRPLLAAACRRLGRWRLRHVLLAGLAAPARPSSARPRPAAARPATPTAAAAACCAPAAACHRARTTVSASAFRRSRRDRLGVLRRADRRAAHHPAVAVDADEPHHDGLGTVGHAPDDLTSPRAVLDADLGRFVAQRIGDLGDHLAPQAAGLGRRVGRRRCSGRSASPSTPWSARPAG